MRALGVLLLLAYAATLHTAAPSNPGPSAAATAIPDAAPRAAAMAAEAAIAASAAAAGALPPLAARAAAVAAEPSWAVSQPRADCRINIVGNSQGGISRASMECSGGLVKIGVHPKLLAAFRKSFRGVVWEPECDLPVFLITFCGNTSVAVSNSTITRVSNNDASELHGVMCLVGNTDMVLRNSTISNNNVTAVDVGFRARLHLFGSTLAANTAVGQPVHGLPGAIMAEMEGVVIVDGGSVISGNRASNHSGGAVALEGKSVFVMSGGSRLINNTSIGGAGGGLAAMDYSLAYIEGESIVCNNTSADAGGGGIAVLGQAKLALVGGSVVCNNTAPRGGGGMIVADNATVTIRSTSIRNNQAFGAGGGLVVLQQGFVAVFDSILENNTCSDVGQFDNGGGGGAVVVNGNATLQLFNGTKMLSNKAVGLPGGAFVVEVNASLTMSAGVLLLDNVVVANTSSRRVPYGSDGTALEAANLIIEPGVLGQGGMLTKCNRSIVLLRRPCGVGEYDGGAIGPCLCCLPATYSFQPNATSCQQCPANAMCSADVVSPVVGFWHSAPRSLQMHMCPISGSCQQGGNCSAGHTGNLCGECSKGYGTTSPLRCGRCMMPRVQLGVYGTLVGVTVSFVTTTVHFTWQDNKAGDRSLRPSDLIKVLVQFVQYVVILDGISVPWPAFLSGMFTAATAVFGVGSGQALSLDCWLPHYVPSKLPLALQRQLSVFVGALIVALACVVLMNLLHVCNRAWTACTARFTGSSRRQQAPQLHFWSRLRVTLLVTAFFAYPTLVRAALSFFACLRIDDASKQPYPEYSIRNHTAGYWVSAIQQECFAGWHRPWALGFGLPAVLVLCIGVPVGLFVFLWHGRAQTADPAFREHYGFLFRNYKESKPWWEAVWAAQTVLLTAVSVFHFTLQAYNALLVMAMVVLISGAAQIAARPYEQPLLHMLHLASTCCLFSLVWLSLMLFSASAVVGSVTLGRVHIATGVVMVMLTCAFVLWCLVLIVRVASPLLREYANSAAAWLQDCTGGVASCKQKAPKPSARNSGSPQQQQQQEQLEDEHQGAGPVMEVSDRV